MKQLRRLPKKLQPKRKYPETKYPTDEQGNFVAMQKPHSLFGVWGC